MQQISSPTDQPTGSAISVVEHATGVYELRRTPEGLRWLDSRTGKPRWLRFRPIPKIRITEDIGEEAAKGLIGQMLDEKHYKLLLDKTACILKPDGQVLCTLLKGRLNHRVLCPGLLDAVRPIIRKAARQPVAGGNRVEAAGAGRAKRKRADGSESNITGVPRQKDLPEEHARRLAPARGGTLGFSGPDVRGGQVLGCRLTAYSGIQAQELTRVQKLAHEVSMALLYSWSQDRWNAQCEMASKTPSDFLLATPEGPTIFTTITCNNRWRTAAHIDSGDLKQGFGALCCLGEFEGCYLVFPRYKLAVRYCEGDVLLADVANEVHGNTPLLNPDGSVPQPGLEPERLVCVFYYEEHMHKCLPSPEAEREFLNNRNEGDPIRPATQKL